MSISNIYVRDDKEKLKVFDHKSAHLPMKKIGKNNPKAEQMEADNLQRKKWNQTVDRALVSGVPEQQIIDVRKAEIGRKTSQSIRQPGSQPDLFASIILIAIKVLELLIMQIINISTRPARKADEAPAKFEIIPPARQSERFAEVTEVSKEEIPDRPKKSILVAKYPRLEDIYERLQEQNNSIAQTEKKLGNLEMELQECKGIFKGKRRKELQEEMERTKKQLEQMKAGLTSIVTSYKYRNVKHFWWNIRKQKQNI